MLDWLARLEVVFQKTPAEQNSCRGTDPRLLPESVTMKVKSPVGGDN